jgi:hypothetical protein
MTNLPDGLTALLADQILRPAGTTLIAKLFGAADQLKSIEPVRFFAGVKEAHQSPDQCRLVDDGWAGLFTDTSHGICE